jgi:hypothetical protein
MSSGPAAGTAGRSTRSPSACESSSFSCSKPNGARLIGLGIDPGDKLVSFAMGGFNVVVAEFDEQKAASRWQQRDLPGEQLLLPHHFNNAAIETFQTDRLVLQNSRHVIAS